MATFTTRTSIRKPGTADNVNVVTDLNDNFDKLDLHLGNLDCTSSTRPTGTNRFVGRTIQESDTKQILVWDGAAWQYIGGFDAGTYTFQITGATSGTWAQGNGALTTYFNRNGRWVDFYAEFTHGSAGTNLGVTGAFNFLLPMATVSPNGTIIGTGLVSDASTGDRYVCAVMVEDSTHHSLVVTRNTTALVSNSVPWAGWAVGDTLRMQGRYRVA